MMKPGLFPLGVIGVVAGLVAASSARLTAQTVNKPSVTVVSFTSDRGPKLSAEAGAAAADELARLLVEGGHYRVLQREWLPIPAANSRPSTSALRKAAAEADVAYIVVGTVGESRYTVVQSYAGGPAVRPQAPFGMPLPGLGPRGHYIPPPPRPRPRRIEHVVTTLDVEVIDVASGRRVNSTTTEWPVAESQRVAAPSAATVAGALVGGPAGAIIATAARVASTKPDPLTPAIRKAIDDVARTLALSAVHLGN